MQEHAQRLHDLATVYAQNNGRLAGILERMTGPTPEAAEATPNTPSPSGVLYVAGFGAERLGIEADKMRSLISRFESLV